jgi:hypothetical protein
MSKAATIALLLSAAVLSTFCDPNSAANRATSHSAQQDTGISQAPFYSGADGVIRIPVPSVRQINDFLRRHGIPLALSTTEQESAAGEPTPPQPGHHKVAVRPREVVGADGLEPPTFAL